MISRIEATRYRCFNRLGVDLAEFNVLAGANGSGKTTLLDLPMLVGDALRHRNVGAAFMEAQKERPPRARSPRELIHKERGDDFIIALEAILPEHIRTDLLKGVSPSIKKAPEKQPTHVRYEIRFQVVDNVELRVANEYLFTFPKGFGPSHESEFHGEREKKRCWKFSLRREQGERTPSDAQGRRDDLVHFLVEGRRGVKKRSVQVPCTRLALPLVQLETWKDFPAARWLYETLLEGCVYFDPDLDLLRRASPPGQPRGLLGNGANLPWLALDLKRRHEKRFAMWIDHVKTALPTLENIDVMEREEDHHAYFAVDYQEGYRVTSSGLSHGTLKILALTLLPYLTELPAMVVAEEPENGIHPQAVETVLQSLSSLYDSQTDVSTHSPVVLARTELDWVIRGMVGKDNSATMIAGPDHRGLKDWKGTLEPRMLFAAGVLG